MPDLLLELGTEELPASAVRRAYTELAEKIRSALVEESILDALSTSISMGTPRRLILSLKNLQERQPDTRKEQRGPGVKAAYDSEGNPTPALIGFCKAQGVNPSDLRQENQYVWATKHVRGRETLEILQEILPKAIRSLTFDKTMRWGSSKMRFARPVRWIVALFDSQVVSFDLEGVHSSNLSCGHRFYSPDKFQVESLDQLIEALRARHVEPDADRRRQMIEDHLPTGQEEFPEISASLLDENVFLTEWPVPILGKFNEDFLGLPAPVLSTVMAIHEKMFPIKDASGEITQKFIFVRNSGEDDSVRKGCEWVLNARLNDAQFFYREDDRLTFDDFLVKTQEIVFQEKLGTVFSRSERLSKIAGALVRSEKQFDDEFEFAKQAAQYSKADLSTGLVSELSSLQGVIGGIYAQRAGMPEAVSYAISQQYNLGNRSEAQTPAERTAARLVMADQIDKLVGYLGIGLEPTGSSDPYGLRRAVTVLIESAWNWTESLPNFSMFIEVGQKCYQEQGVSLDLGSICDSVSRLFATRYSHLMPGVAHDLLDAAIQIGDSIDSMAPQMVKFRVQVLSELSQNETFLQSATRPLNILSSAKKKLGSEIGKGALNHQALDSTSGGLLYELALQSAEILDEAIRDRNVARAVEILLQLEDPINKFFEETMVMAEDTDVRSARLVVVAKVNEALLKVGDFTKIVFKGEQ